MGGWSYFGTEIVDVMEGFALTHKGLSDAEMLAAVKRDPGLVDLMAANDMGDEDFLEFLRTKRDFQEELTRIRETNVKGGATRG